MDKPKTTPKDFFLYVSSFATLYVSAVSLVSLLFAIINKAFPDALNVYYTDLYSGGMRFAIASLIIVFPIYLVIAVYLNKYLRANPERKEVSVRKWLTFFTLFLTGVTVVSDLIVLVNTFLGGEITTRFILKVIAVLVVALAVFGYYLYDMRKTFSAESKNRTTLIVSLACVLVFGSLITGFIIVGSPMTARAMRFDVERTNDLSTIQWQVINFWQQKGALPVNMSDLNDSISGFAIPVDPETGKSYVYETTSDLGFKLCADFALAAPENQSQVRGTENWQHGAGHVCFDRTIDPDLYPVNTKSLRGL